MTGPGWGQQGHTGRKEARYQAPWVLIARWGLGRNREAADRFGSLSFSSPRSSDQLQLCLPGHLPYPSLALCAVWYSRAYLRCGVIQTYSGGTSPVNLSFTCEWGQGLSDLSQRQVVRTGWECEHNARERPFQRHTLKEEEITGMMWPQADLCPGSWPGILMGAGQSWHLIPAHVCSPSPLAFSSASEKSFWVGRR